jgi:hypothetical protein
LLDYQELERILDPWRMTKPGTWNELGFVDPKHKTSAGGFSPLLAMDLITFRALKSNSSPNIAGFSSYKFHFTSSIVGKLIRPSKREKPVHVGKTPTSYFGEISACA